MATGGYKAAEWITTIKTSTTASVTAESAKLIIKNVCNLIIQCEPHWTHDADYTATEDDFIKISSGTANLHQEYAHFLINTTTGSRLLVCYKLGGYETIPDVCCCHGGGYTFAAGLCFSIIPGGTNSVWDISDDCTTIAMIPNEATLLLGPCNLKSSTSASPSTAPILRSTSGSTQTRNLKYTVIAKEDQIVILLARVGGGDMSNCICIGKIFGELCNETDNAYNSKYGALLFSDYASGISEYYNPDYMWLNTRTSTKYAGSCVVCYFRDTTTTRPVQHDDPHSMTECAATNVYVSPGLRTSSITSGKTAFCALNLSHATDDANSYGVVPGNCFKGYLDTDLVRVVYYGFPYDTKFDGGNFIYAGGGIALGWDPSNSIGLLG